MCVFTVLLIRVNFSFAWFQVIVSDAFNGKPLIERHRMVNDIFKEELKEIHALTLKTLTPEQFEKLKTN